MKRFTMITSAAFLLASLAFGGQPTTVNAQATMCQGLVVTIVGTSGSNIINGTSGNDVIHGLGGNDIIDGKGGNDTICGGDGADEIQGSGGADVLNGGNGNDILRGGDGGTSSTVAPGLISTMAGWAITTSTPTARLGCCNR